jgi:hypothetical protein
VRPCSAAICAGRHRRGVKPQATRNAVFDGEKEAKLIALACSQPLEGRAKWTLRLLERKVVELNIVDHASDNTIGRVQKKNKLKPHLKQPWVILPQASSAFVAAMEDVLAVYKRPRDGDYPLVCLDETSKQLLADTRASIPMKPGQPERRDYEYERNGAANLFMMFAPLEGWRHIEITDRRTAIDYARTLEALSDTHFPKRQEDRSGCSGAGQPQYPQTCLAL